MNTGWHRMPRRMPEGRFSSGCMGQAARITSTDFRRCRATSASRWRPSSTQLPTTEAFLIDRDVRRPEIRRMYRAHIAGRRRRRPAPVVRGAPQRYTVTPDRGFIDRSGTGKEPRDGGRPRAPGHGFKHSCGIGQAVAQVYLVEKRSSVDLLRSTLVVSKCSQNGMLGRARPLARLPARACFPRQSYQTQHKVQFHPKTVL